MDRSDHTRKKNEIKKDTLPEFCAQSLRQLKTMQNPIEFTNFTHFNDDFFARLLKSPISKVPSCMKGYKLANLRTIRLDDNDSIQMSFG